jgi:hypothetical protein
VVKCEFDNLIIFVFNDCHFLYVDGRVAHPFEYQSGLSDQRDPFIKLLEQGKSVTHTKIDVDGINLETVSKSRERQSGASDPVKSFGLVPCRAPQLPVSCCF